VKSEKWKRRSKSATVHGDESGFLTKSLVQVGRRCALRLSVGQPPELVGRAYRFSIAALRFYRKLPKSQEAQVPGVQFYRAATSTWSNYRAAQRGRSRAEFIAKLGTAVEESDEAVGWLEFMRDAEIGSDRGLLGEAKEICAMLTASLTNARGRGGK